MSKTMLVNVTHVEESRVAILDDGVLAAYEIETINRTSIKGNIYNAIVESIHPSLEAAFLRIDHGLKGFLPLDEINFRLLPSRTDDRSRGKIGQHLNQGQRLLVQVVREPFAGKPPTVSTYFSLPGRFLVLMPGVDSGGVSRNIADGSQRERLKKIVEELQPPEGFGVIVRTAGEGQTKAELQRDLRYLLRLWESIQKGSEGGDFPGLVYRERDVVIRTIRDHLTPEIREVWIDNPETYDRALEFIKDVMPNKGKFLRLYTGERPLFNKYNLEEQIETIYKRRVPLPSGGEIVIDGTEALTAIDVNSLQTNLEAAAEIARQLRLRDLGGLIVVDFIDMMATRNQKKVEKAMRDAMKGDKARYDVTRLSKLGLMELARQRIKGAKLGATYTSCPACEGYGLVKTVESAALAALRKLQTRCSRGGFGKMRMSLPPEVAGWILNFKREEVLQQEQRHDLVVLIESNPALLRHESEFETFPREKRDDSSVPPPEVLAATRATEPEPEPVEAEEAPAAKPAGRKRRRRRKKSAKSETAGESVPEETPAEAGSGPDEGASKPEEPAASPAAKNPKQETPKADTGEQDGGDDTPAGAEAARKRKRRRRRRKSRSSAASVNGDAPESGSKPGGGEDATPEVPRHVKADELMPAAVGQGEGGRSRRGGSRSRRRR